MTQEGEYVQGIHNFCNPEEVRRKCLNPNCEKKGNCNDPYCGHNDNETYSERLWGLTEMFPGPIRRFFSKIVSWTTLACRKVYCCSCCLGWYMFLAAAILFIPPLFEIQYNRRLQALKAIAPPPC